MNAQQLRELADIIENAHYTQEIEMPKNGDMTQGMANFVQMAINEIEAGNIREALLKLVDLKSDIGSAYVCK